MRGGQRERATPPMFFMHGFPSPSASSLRGEVRVMARVTLLEFFSCLTALWKGQPIKAWINCSIMCVWVGACGFSHTLALSLLLGSHEYALALNVLEGSVVQNSNHVSVFELSPPLFDIGSDVATHEASWVAVLTHSPPLIFGAGPQGVSVRPAGTWHAILILQIHFSSFMSSTHLWKLPCDWHWSSLNIITACVFLKLHHYVLSMEQSSLF